MALGIDPALGIIVPSNGPADGEIEPMPAIGDDLAVPIDLVRRVLDLEPAVRFEQRARVVDEALPFRHAQDEQSAEDVVE